MDQVLDIRSDGANHGKHNHKTETIIEMTARCAKPSRCWARPWVELSPPQCKERWRRNEEELGGQGERWVQVRRGKNLRQGECLDKDKDKTDSTTTNKQDPQDTPAGWRIYIIYYYTILYIIYLLNCLWSYRYILNVNPRFDVYILVYNGVYIYVYVLNVDRFLHS